MENQVAHIDVGAIAPRPDALGAGVLAPSWAEPAKALPQLATLADVLAQLEADPSPDRRCVEMKCAVRRMGDALRRALVDVPADPARLRELISAASPVATGMAKGRWSRVRSLTLAALQEVGLDIAPGRDVGGLSPGWRVLADGLPKTLRLRLSRLMSYCTRLGLEPVGVNTATFEGFEAALLAKSLKTNPQAIFRETVRSWLKAAATMPAWPQVQVGLERHSRFYSLEWTAFPSSFVDDLEAFLSDSGNRDVLDDDYAPQVKPSTIDLRRRQIRQLASVLVASGLPLEKVTSLAVLVEPANVTAALRFQRSRQGGKLTSSLGQQAWLLCTIARHWVKARDHADRLADIARRLNVKQTGMTPRNRARLRQFDLPANREAFLSLSAKVVARAECQRIDNLAEARRVMLAVAVEILTIAPMRVGNLTALEHDRHIVTFGRGKRPQHHLIIPGGETKTGEDFEAILPTECAHLLDLYLKRYRARLSSSPSPFLFPSSSGKQRNTTSFSKAISAFVEAETGIKMHAHLFRQLAGKFHLDQNPSDLETVRRLLGHKSSNTTSRYYAEQKTSQAFQRYDGTIAKLRAGGGSAAIGGEAGNKGRDC